MAMMVTEPAVPAHNLCCVYAAAELLLLLLVYLPCRSTLLLTLLNPGQNLCCVNAAAELLLLLVYLPLNPDSQGPPRAPMVAFPERGHRRPVRCGRAPVQIEQAVHCMHRWFRPSLWSWVWDDHCIHTGCANAIVPGCQLLAGSLRHMMYHPV